MSKSRTISRRTFLTTAAMGAGAAALAACGAAETATSPSPSASASAATSPGASAAATASASGSAAATPAASAGAAVAGKIPAPIAGVPDAYTQMPELAKTFNTPPGKGGTVRNLTISYAPPPTPKAQNQYWQELEKRLGVTWEPTIVPQPTYGEKTAAVVASGDLGDLFYVNPGQSAPHLYRTMSQGAFLDITPYVTGAAVQEFPNIAALPEYLWNNVKFNGKLYGVPKPIQRAGNIPFYRGDWAQKLNIATPKTADEVYNMFVAFSKNDPDGNGQGDTWGLGQFSGGWFPELAMQMFRVPYNWRLNADGTLTHMIETDEYRQAVTFLKRLWDGGAFHPDSPAMNFQQAQENFIAGRTGAHSEGFASFFVPNGIKDRTKTTTATADVVGLVPPGPDGGQGVVWNTIGYFGFAAIPASVGGDQERVKELLHILDYLMSPFGTEEQFFLSFGLEGVHHTMDNGVPTITEQGRADIGDLVYIMGSSPIYFFPQAPGRAEEAQRQAVEVMQIGIDDPTFGQYSATNVSAGTELNQLVRDRLTGIVTGREPLEALDDFIAQWRSRGGDTIRTEFEQSIKGA